MKRFIEWLDKKWIGALIWMGWKQPPYDYYDPTRDYDEPQGFFRRLWWRMASYLYGDQRLDRVRRGIAVNENINVGRLGMAFAGALDERAGQPIVIGRL